MCTMKKKFQMIGFALSVLLVTLPVATVGADNAASGKQKKEKTTESALGVKPVTGSWINLAYKDVRNKYTNPQSFDNMDPKLWEAKVRELSAMGIEYLVLMEVANEGKSYYPSQIMPWWYNKDKKSPVDAILDEAAKHNMKIFMSSGWAKDQDDNLLDPAIKERQLRIMEELASLYKNHKAFYGWYLPVEDCLCPIFAEHAVQSVNTLSEKAKKLAPGKKTLISPYGIGLSEFDNPEYEKQMQKLKVDIIAYQDEVMEGSTGTNSTAIGIARNGVPCAVVSFPLRYMHTPCEVVCLDDLEAAAQLLAHYLLQTEGGVKNA